MALEARTSVGRNDPCPCGNGKKYKNCCMRLDIRRARLGKPTSEDEDYEPPSKTVPVAIAVVTLVAAVGMGVAYGLEIGGLFGVVGALVLGGYFIFRDPPPPRSDGADPSGLNFGR